MSGHSKWANIKFRKAAQDKKKGKVFSKLIREITIAARMFGGEINSNPRLRLAVDKALTKNMTKDTIERAIKRGAGGEEGVTLEEIMYEGYGPVGVAVMVECMTDNRTRTIAEVRHAFTKAGYNIGTPGSVAYLFTKRGEILFAPGTSEEKVMEVALDAGAEDVIVDEDKSILVITSPDHLTSIKEAMEKAGLKPEQAEINMHASTQAPITDKETAQKLFNFIDVLEELDDVQNVYTNADVADEILKTLE